jgi:hypothetical protein
VQGSGSGSGFGELTDDELLDGLENGTLAPADFRHREHLRAAWAALDRWGRAGAEQRLLAGLASLAARAGQPGKFDAALTRAWLDALDAARREHPGARTVDELAAVRPDLLDVRRVRITNDALP